MIVIFPQAVKLKSESTSYDPLKTNCNKYISKKSYILSCILPQASFHHFDMNPIANFVVLPS